MTKNIFFRSSALLVLLSLLVSCSAERRFHRRLTGSWNVVRYEQRFANGDTQVSSDLGSLTFRKNGSGDNDLGVLTRTIAKPEDRGFSWKNTETEVTIISRNSLLAKSWIVIQNKRSYQQWKSTNQATVQTMELRKKK